MHVLSTIMLSNSMYGYLAATSLQHWRKSPSLCFMMLALCTAVTFLRLFLSAYWNAYSAIRIDFSRDMIFKLSTTPGTVSCSRPEYSPSVFSRMTTTSTPGWRVSTPGIFLQCTTFAKRSKVVLRMILIDFDFDFTGVLKGPLRATPFFRKLATTASGTPSSRSVNSKRSNSTGTSAASNTLIIEFATSNPMPSPGINVTGTG
mmetsp:Transcript_40831/g.161739  ORF Transcript_40831/g.161739 Transcript_40831/m.161739 type:complete len:203 (+) Transcript_40831:1404-2012(+)